MLLIKQRLEALPDELQKFAPSEYRAQLRSDLESAIYAVLQEMSAWTLRIEGHTDELDDDEG